MDNDHKIFAYLNIGGVQNGFSSLEFGVGFAFMKTTVTVWFRITKTSRSMLYLFFFCEAWCQALVTVSDHHHFS